MYCLYFLFIILKQNKFVDKLHLRICVFFLKKIPVEVDMGILRSDIKQQRQTIIRKTGNRVVCNSHGSDLIHSKFKVKKGTTDTDAYVHWCGLR